jgi:hypothetical protein
MLSDLYDATMTLYSYEITDRGANGGIIRTLVPLTSNVPCYITPISGNETYKFGKNNIIGDFRMFVDPMEISTTNLVKVVDEFGTTWFNVLYIDNADDLDHHFEVDLLEVKAPVEFTG